MREVLFDGNPLTGTVSFRRRQDPKLGYRHRKNIRFDANVIGMLGWGLSENSILRLTVLGCSQLGPLHRGNLLFLSEASSFTVLVRFSKNGEFKTRHQNQPCVGSPCHRKGERVV